MPSEAKIILNRLAKLAPRLARALLRGAARALRGLGWRGGAVALGVAFGAWASAMLPAMLESTAEARATAPQTASVTGSVSAEALSARPEWVPIARPVASFALGLPDVDGQRVVLEARRDQGSALREDILGAGQFEAEGAYLRIGLQRHVTRRQPAFYVALSRRVAEFGLSVERSAQALPTASKFGPIEAADVVLASGQRKRACLAFRHVAEEEALTIHGLFCGSAVRVADRQQLTCLLDRLQLVGAADDRALRAHFSKAELNRQPQCLTPKLQAAGRRTSWLDADQPAPKLRRTGG